MPSLNEIAKRRGWHALGIEIGLDDTGKPKTRFRIFKAGLNTSTQGPFLFDEKSAASVMAEFARHGVTLTADYEHQTLLSKTNGKPAPASAYSWKPEIINGELWATDVHWTDAAALSIEKREYNFFSPLFKNTKTGRVTEIVNFALTNVPSLDDQEPLIAAAALTRGGDGDDDDDDKETAMKKCSACKEEIGDGESVMHSSCATSKATALTALTTALGIAVGADTQIMVDEASGLVALRADLRRITGKEKGGEALAVIMGWKANSDEITALKAKLAGEEAVRLEGEVTKVFADAQKDLKLTDAEVTALRAIAIPGGKATAESLTALKAYIATRTPFATSPDRAVRQPDPAGAITPDDEAAARLLGHSPKWVSDQRAEQAKRGQA